MADRDGADLIHADIVAILEALGLGTHARPYSSHEVVHRDILPAIKALRGEQCRPMVNYALFGMAPMKVCAVHRVAWRKDGCPNA